MLTKSSLHVAQPHWQLCNKGAGGRGRPGRTRRNSTRRPLWSKALTGAKLGLGAGADVDGCSPCAGADAAGRSSSVVVSIGSGTASSTAATARPSFLLTFGMLGAAVRGPNQVAQRPYSTLSCLCFAGPNTSELGGICCCGNLINQYQAAVQHQHCMLAACLSVAASLSVTGLQAIAAAGARACSPRA